MVGTWFAWIAGVLSVVEVGTVTLATVSVTAVSVAGSVLSALGMETARSATVKGTARTTPENLFRRACCPAGP